MEPGQRVTRREDRPVTGATVLEVVEDEDGIRVRIAYDEGGTGWWPASELEAE